MVVPPWCVLALRGIFCLLTFWGFVVYLKAERKSTALWLASVYAIKARRVVTLWAGFLFYQFNVT